MNNDSNNIIIIHHPERKFHRSIILKLGAI